MNLAQLEMNFELVKQLLEMIALPGDCFSVHGCNIEYSRYSNMGCFYPVGSVWVKNFNKIIVLLRRRYDNDKTYEFDIRDPKSFEKAAACLRKIVDSIDPHKKIMPYHNVVTTFEIEASLW